jgi:hypothetical protein
MEIGGSDSCFYQAARKKYPQNSVGELDTSSSRDSESGVLCRFQQSSNKVETYLVYLTNGGCYSAREISCDSWELPEMDKKE